MIIRKRKLGRGVALVGAGMSQFGVHPTLNTRDLFIDAFLDMKKSVQKGIEPKDIECLYLGNAASELYEAQGSLSAMVTSAVGLTPMPSVKIEAACASSGVAFREGVLGVASGIYDVVLVGGTERMNTMPTDWSTLALATYSNTLYEGSAGFSFPALYASIANAYMHKYCINHDELLKVAIKNHHNGALNPKAHFKQTIRDLMESRIAKAKQKGEAVPSWADELAFLNDPKANPTIAWPNSLFDCCPVTDGAACALLVSEEIAKNFTDSPIYVIGTGHATGFDLNDRDVLTTIPATKFAAEQAYGMAGVKPADIKMAEVHDCFTIAEVLALADLGFFAEGKEAATAAGLGKTARDGIKPVNASGGLKCKGHPIGASGVAMTVEIFEQMHGHAGARQIKKDIDVALTHNVGAHGTNVAVHIFEKRG
jgi:acetyl-CoA C-acetyltransferase